MKLLGLLLAATVSAQTIVVSPDGPIRSLTAARDAARAQRRTGRTGTITVELRDGTYFLSETLVLTPEDSQTVWQAAPGARPVISGGRVISGWKKGPRQIWTADVSGPDFRQLFVGGRRAQRARTPNNGFYRIDGPSSQDKPFTFNFRGGDIKPEWAAGGAEVVALLAWAEIRLPIALVDAAAHTAKLEADPRPSNRETDARYFIENSLDGLDSAGEWYLDRTHGRGLLLAPARRRSRRGTR